MNFIGWCETDASQVAGSEGMKNTHFRRRNKPRSTSPPVVNLDNSSRKVASVRKLMQPMLQDLVVLSFYIRVCSDLNHIQSRRSQSCTHRRHTTSQCEVDTGCWRRRRRQIYFKLSGTLVQHSGVDLVPNRNGSERVPWLPIIESMPGGWWSRSSPWVPRRLD